MKALIPWLAALAFVLSGCGDSGQKEKAAIKAVFDTQQGESLSHQFPATPKSVRCVIRGGRYAPDIRQPGNCATLVSISPNGSAVVLFRETWAGADLAYYGASCPAREGPCFPGGHQTHTWAFTVTKDGQIWSFDTYGDIAPQDVH